MPPLPFSPLFLSLLLFPPSSSAKDSLDLAAARLLSRVVDGELEQERRNRDADERLGDDVGVEAWRRHEDRLKLPEKFEVDIDTDDDDDNDDDDDVDDPFPLSFKPDARSRSKDEPQAGVAFVLQGIEKKIKKVGKGRRKRKKDEGIRVVEVKEEEEEKWGSWSEWSRCRPLRHRRIGFQRRRRRCRRLVGNVFEDVECRGTDTQVRPCREDGGVGG